MSLVNTATDKRIANPSHVGQWMEVDFVFILPTIDSRESCTVQVRLSTSRENDNGDMGIHNIGLMPINGLNDPEQDDKLHAFCIEKLGSNFERPLTVG